MHVPACFLDLEIANILWKKVGRDEITREEADLILGHLPSLPISRHPEPALLGAAFDLANRTQRTVYDCLYIALAVEIGGPMVTADERLCNSLSGTAWAPFVRWVGDVPAHE